MDSLKWIGSNAALNFEGSIGVAEELLSIHVLLGTGKRGRPGKYLEALKRATIIMAVTAWETYIEDFLLARFRDSIAKAVKPQDVASSFNAAAHRWLETHRHKPPELARWAGDSWKDTVRAYVDAEVAAFHTPNSTNIRALSRRLSGTDVTEHWHWRGISTSRAAARLDKLIRRRGELAHQGKRLLEENADVRLREARDAIALCRALARATEMNDRAG